MATENSWIGQKAWVIFNEALGSEAAASSLLNPQLKGLFNYSFFLSLEWLFKVIFITKVEAIKSSHLKNVTPDINLKCPYFAGSRPWYKQDNPLWRMQ